MLIYVKWLIIALLKLPLLLTVPFAAVIVPLFYRADKDEDKGLYEQKTVSVCTSQAMGTDTFALAPVEFELATRYLNNQLSLKLVDA